MGIAICWHDPEKSILRMTYEDPWNWYDFEKSLDQSDDFLDNVDREIPVIVDFSRSSLVPKGALRHFREAALRTHPNQGTLYFVKPSQTLRIIGSVMARIYPVAASRVTLVSSIEEALNLIQKSKAPR